MSPPLYSHNNRQKNTVPNASQNWTIRLPFDGANGSTTITDASATGRTTIGVFGGGGVSNITTSDYQWGGASIYLLGDQGSRVQNTVSDSTLAPGTGDFTLEFWYKVYNWSTHSTYRSAIFDSYSGSNTGRMFIYHNTSGKIVLWSSGANILASNTTIQLGIWYRVALVRNAGTMKWVINGADDASTVSSINLTGTGFMIGANFDYASVAGVLFNGYVDEFRMIKGTALY